MRKILSVLLLLVCTISISAKDVVVGNYHCSYNKKDYKIIVNADNGNYEDVYIETPNLSRYKYSVICIKKKRLTDFKQTLTELKAKYSEWKKVAVDNNVSELTKDIEIECPKIGVYWKSGEKYYGLASVSPTMRFQVSYNKILDKTIFCVNMFGQVTAATNQFITCTFIFPFLEESEFDTILNAISDENIANAISGNESVQDLFK